MDLQKRERKVDLSSMTNEQVENISAQVGERVRQICDEAAAKVNAILNIYGASAKIAIAFDGLPKKEETKPKLSARKGVKRKKLNLK